MQPTSNRSNPTGSPLAPPRPPPFALADDANASGFDATPTGPVGSAPLRLTAPALFIEARFRGVALAGRLLRADEPRTFAIGNARGCDAPVNPAWLPETGAPPEPRRHVFLEPVPGGFVLHLTAAMRPRLERSGQRLPLGPDTGRAQAPLMLPPGCSLHVPCGEVSFDIHPAEPVAALPRPWLAPGWRIGAKYLLAVALLLGLILLIAHLVPSDPRALSLDTLDDSVHFAHLTMIPLQVNAPAIDSARSLQQTAGGSGSAAAAKPSGQAGDRKAPREANGRMAIKGTARPEDARAVAAKIHDNTLLAVLDGPRTSALADVLSDGPVLGSAARDVLGNLVALNDGPGYGFGALGVLGTGAGGGGEHEGTLGAGGPLGTRGRFGGHGGPDYGTGPGVGGLHTRQAVVPEPIPGIASVRGSLDKEIIRRIVRRHLNEVKYCYQQALVHRPSMEGRLVTQFTIAPTGRVLASAVQSSTLKEVSVEACVVNAIKRWEFPQPDHGGMAIVSYPFTFAPAGD
jgi:hypothetical protein